MTITACRVCGNTKLANILSLGDQAFSGYFPKPGKPVDIGPLTLVRCDGGCGLVQLADSFPPRKMYGDDYGYRSGLNNSMVKHLETIVNNLSTNTVYAPLESGDLVIDIGSNDGTTLGMFPEICRRVGVDPTGEKFKAFYKPGIELIPDFFTADTVIAVVGEQKAKVITSIAMFYDLESPMDFMKDIARVLHRDGVWAMEQSYLPYMMDMNAFDTVCHEHIEYYSLAQITYMASRCGLDVIRAFTNDTNGGSFGVILAHAGRYTEEGDVRVLRERERAHGLDQQWVYDAFNHRTSAAIIALGCFLHQQIQEGKKVYGLGASTKGNILLHMVSSFLGYTPLLKIGDVNADKFGCVTPGTNIPIVSEDEALADNPDFFVVLPWHFRQFFLTSPKFKGRKLIFPLPMLEVIVP